MKSINRVFFSEDYITIAFVVCLIFLFLMKVYKPKQLLGYTIAFFTQGFIEKRAEKNMSSLHPFSILLELFSFLIIAISLYFLFMPDSYEKRSYYVVIIFAFTFLFFLIKKAIELLIVSLFSLKSTLNYLLYSKNGYLYTCCLLLFPCLVLYQYVFNSIYFLWGVILFLLVFRLLLILSNNKKLVIQHLFYFILYFCALELAPILLLHKSLN